MRADPDFPPRGGVLHRQPKNNAQASGRSMPQPVLISGGRYRAVGTVNPMAQAQETRQRPSAPSPVPAVASAAAATTPQAGRRGHGLGRAFNSRDSAPG
jgi:hypothetical protein